MGLKLFLLRNWRRLTGRSPYPLNDDLDGLKSNWDKMGRIDPCYAICTLPGKENRKWNQEEFFATGRTQIDKAISYAVSLAPSLEKRRALDFGCGLGRLTQAMGEHFEQVDGVDISDEMLRQASELGAPFKHLRFTKITSTTLPFGDKTFNFVYSHLVLQHMKSELALAYVREFVRVLTPGGVALFQAPSRNLEHPQTSFSCPHDFAGQPAFMEMHGHPRKSIESAVTEAGGRMLNVRPEPAAGAAWESFDYAVTR